MSTAVLDASAVLALLFREPGGESVTEHLPGSVLSTVNLAEVCHKVHQRGVSPSGLRRVQSALEVLGVRIESTFTAEDATRSAEIWAVAHHLGLSLGDRCCLAVTAGIPEAYAVTADTAWARLPDELGIQVRCIR